MKRTNYIILILLVAVVGFAAYYRLSSNKEILDQRAAERSVEIIEVPVRVSAVEKTTVDHSIERTSTFRAHKELPIMAEARGRISGLFIRPGQAVARGQTLAKIDDASLRSRLDLARLSLGNAEKNVERYQNLLNAGAISRQQFEKIALELENARVQVATIEQELGYSTVRSPLSGIVKEVKLEQGSFAIPGSPLAMIVDISRLKLILQLSEQEVIKIQEGQEVEILAEVYPDHVFNGRVTVVSVQADQARKFDVEVELPNSTTHPLKDGMLGTVKLKAGPDNNETVLVIPRNAVIGSLLDPRAYVAEDGTARVRPLQVGEVINDLVVVRQGLSEGENVITTGQINLEDGRRIAIVE